MPTIVQEMVDKEDVDTVNTFGFGLRRRWLGPGWFADVLMSSQCYQGLECSSSPTSGTVFPQVSGVLIFSLLTKVDFEHAGWYCSSLRN
jgi:hypothetical protein